MLPSWIYAMFAKFT